MVYKHNKITMPQMKVFQSNAFRLKKGTIYESIKLLYVSEKFKSPDKEITNYEYDTESRVIYLPDYEKENIHGDRKIFIKYDIEVDCIRHSDSFTDNTHAYFQIDKDRTQ